MSSDQKDDKEFKKKEVFCLNEGLWIHFSTRFTLCTRGIMNKSMCIHCTILRSLDATLQI